MSRLLLENSNNTEETTLYNLEKGTGLDWSEKVSVVPWNTPKGSKDLRIQAKDFSCLDNLDNQPAASSFERL